MPVFTKEELMELVRWAAGKANTTDLEEHDLRVVVELMYNALCAKENGDL